MKPETLVNDIALRSFRDVGDGDYIAARMACPAAKASHRASRQPLP